jgi:hypothetical protein
MPQKSRKAKNVFSALFDERLQLVICNLKWGRGVEL